MKKLILIWSICLYASVFYGQIFYTDIAVAAGIHHKYVGVLGGGVSFYDFSGDGLDDLTLATGEGEKIQFYLNEGGDFTELFPLVDHSGQVKQILWADIDNDGDSDLFITAYDGPNKLYENKGDLTFEDVTESAGLMTNDNPTYGACIGDYDRDGWLDIYFNERVPFMSQENRHYLFRNNAGANISFTNVTEYSGTKDVGGVPFCSAFLDYNNDRWPDIYTAHDKFSNPNTLFENNGDASENGTTFTNVSDPSNSDISIDAMCVTAGDYNNDGNVDIYVTNTHMGNALLQNLGPFGDQYKFADIAQFSGTSFNGVGWSSVFLDADNDCDLDLYVSGSLSNSDTVSSAFYENINGSSFQRVYDGFEKDTTTTYSNAWGDINNDGYPDIFAQNQTPYKSQLWENSGGDFNWLKIDLQGVLSNRDAIGSLVELYVNGIYQMRYTQCGSGFLGQNSGVDIFGIGEAEIVDSIVVTWPTGHVDKLYDVENGQTISVLEGSTTQGEINVDDDVVLLVPVSNIKDEFEEYRVVISPSPANKVLSIAVDNLAPNSIWVIFDINGRLVKQGKLFSDNSVDVYDLNSGIHYLSIFEKGEWKVTKSWLKK